MKWFTKKSRQLIQAKWNDVLRKSRQLIQAKWNDIHNVLIKSRQLIQGEMIYLERVDS